MNLQLQHIPCYVLAVCSKVLKVSSGMFGKIIFAFPLKVEDQALLYRIGESLSLACAHQRVYDERGFEKGQRLERLEGSIAVCHSTLCLPTRLELCLFDGQFESYSEEGCQKDEKVILV